jgi:hypothetical protein
MPEKRTLVPSHRAEKRLVKMAAEAVKEDCTNPERIGCPSSDAVRAVVGRRLGFPDFENIVDHIATCAPCFREYTRQRQRNRLRTAGVAVLSCAVLVVLGLLWKHGTPTQLHPKETVAREAPTPVVAATLDYSNWTLERSEQSRPRTAAAPHLTRGLLDLTIGLPIGTEDGAYTVQFLSNDNQAVAEAVGGATWDGTAEALKIRTDLRNVPAGAYTVAIRSARSSLRRYPVILE